MRVLLETSPVVSTFKDPRDGQLHEGMSSVRVVIYEPDEVPRAGDGSVREVPTLAQWRKNMNSHGTIVVGPAENLVGAQVAVITPEQLLGVPETARVEFQWTFE